MDDRNLKRRDGIMSLSVIIPNFNNEPYLNQCIESVLGQTHQPQEILIVDDCSTDRSREIIQRFAQQYPIVRPLFLKENRGVSHARNEGIKNAESEYVTCLDADDFYMNPRKLENELRLLSEWKGNAVAYSKVAFVEKKAGTWRVFKPPFRSGCYLQGDVFARFLAGYQFKTSPRDYIVKKEIVLECGGYDESMNLYEDTDLLMRLSQKLEFYCTGEFGTGYRMKEGGLSKKPKKDHKAVWNQMFHRYYDELCRKEKVRVRMVKLYADILHIPVEIRNVLYRWKVRVLRLNQ